MRADEQAHRPDGRRGRGGPRLLEATLVPAVLFFVTVTTIGPVAAMIVVLAWGYGTIARRDYVEQPNQNNPSTGGIGPTFDGRRKPEIWAPGTGIFSASSTNTSGYVSSTGTSMACPAITGYCALVRQYYMEGRNFPTATARRRSGPSILPAL